MVTVVGSLDGAVHAGSVHQHFHGRIPVVLRSLVQRVAVPGPLDTRVVVPEEIGWREPIVVGDGRLQAGENRMRDHMRDRRVGRPERQTMTGRFVADLLPRAQGRDDLRQAFGTANGLTAQRPGTAVG
ncbi:hypothetical protein D3C73_847090 [compost metagenome]